MIAVLNYWKDEYGIDTYVKGIYPTLKEAEQNFSDNDRWIEFNYGLVDFDWSEAKEFKNNKSD